MSSKSQITEHTQYVHIFVCLCFNSCANLVKSRFHYGRISPGAHHEIEALVLQIHHFMCLQDASVCL
jgi:hypothetical protein